MKVKPLVRGSLLVLAIVLIAALPATAFTPLFSVPTALGLKPGCTVVTVKFANDGPVPGALVQITSGGFDIASSPTGNGGKATFCDILSPNTQYLANAVSSSGIDLGSAPFTTDNSGSASVRILV